MNNIDVGKLLERLRLQQECGMFALPSAHEYVGFGESADAIVAMRECLEDAFDLLGGVNDAADLRDRILAIIAPAAIAQTQSGDAL